MLLTKTVMMKWNGKNKKYYESKGYVFTKMRDEFEVKVEDLTEGSSGMVEVKCDCKDCKSPYLKPMKYDTYKTSVRSDGAYYCRNCAIKIFGSKKIKNTLLEKHNISFGYWLLKNLPLKQAVSIIARWDEEKNKCDIRDVGYASNGFNKKGYYFKCLKHPEHESELKSINNFVSTLNFNIMSCNKCNSLGILYPKSIECWSDKNKKSPYDYTPNSHAEVWWKCENGKHEDYQRDIKSSKFCHFRCPECISERDESFLQEKVRLYLEFLSNGKYMILHENKCTLNPKNPIKLLNKKRNTKLEYDNEIIINNKHLFIEVMGKQHKYICTWHKKLAILHNTTPQRELDYQIAKDKFKEHYVYEQGENYYYLAVWYYDDNDAETYKQLINNKIKEVSEK